MVSTHTTHTRKSFAFGRALKSLSSSEQQALIGEWRKSAKPKSEITYVPLIIEEVVKRARRAAHRTSKW